MVHADPLWQFLNQHQLNNNYWLQNKLNFLNILGEQMQKQGKCKGKGAKKITSPRTDSHFAFHQKNYAFSAGYNYCSLAIDLFPSIRSVLTYPKMSNLFSVNCSFSCSIYVVTVVSYL